MNSVEWDRERWNRFSALIVDEVATVLRDVWKCEWKKRQNIDWSNPSTLSSPFCNNNTCIQYYIDMEKRSGKMLKGRKMSYDQLLKGNDIECWDTSLLVAILQSSCIFQILKLTDKQIPAIEVIRVCRNEYFGHASKTQMCQDEFTTQTKSILKALRFLGATKERRAQIRDMLHKPMVPSLVVASKKTVYKVLKVKVEPKDPQYQLNSWLKSHFPGAYRQSTEDLHTQPDSQCDYYSLTQYGADDNVLKPKLQLHVLDTILPVLTENVTLLIGNRKLLENGLSDGSVDPEIENERWILGLTDSKLDCEHCIVYYCHLHCVWLIEAHYDLPSEIVLTMRMNGTKTVTVVIPGKPVRLVTGMTIRMGKHKLIINELTVVIKDANLCEQLKEDMDVINTTEQVYAEDEAEAVANAGVTEDRDCSSKMLESVSETQQETTAPKCTSPSSSLLPFTDHKTTINNASNSGLTAEQLRRIEENRFAALVNRKRKREQEALLKAYEASCMHSMPTTDTVTSSITTTSSSPPQSMKPITTNQYNYTMSSSSPHQSHSTAQHTVSQQQEQQIHTNSSAQPQWSISSISLNNKVTGQFCGSISSLDTETQRKIAENKQRALEKLRQKQLVQSSINAYVS